MHPLETERLIIREFQQDDADVIYRIVDEPLGWGAANSEERGFDDMKALLEAEMVRRFNYNTEFVELRDCM